MKVNLLSTVELEAIRNTAITDKKFYDKKDCPVRFNEGDYVVIRNNCE